MQVHKAQCRSVSVSALSTIVSASAALVAAYRSLLTPGTAATASGDNVLKARSKKKKFASLGRLEKNLEIFRETQKKLDDRYYKSTALVATAATASADNVLKARSKKKKISESWALRKKLRNISRNFKVSELRKVSCSAVTAPSLERLQA